MRPQSRVRNKTKHTSVVTTVTPVSPGIPRAMVLTAYFVLSPATNSSCHRHPRIKGLYKARSGTTYLRGFNTSNGCQDHTALPYAESIVRLHAIRQLTGLVDPPCHPLTSPDAAASTAS